MPEEVKPMLATTVEAPADEAGWLYEIKWDGFRALAYVQNGKVAVRSRNNKSFNDKFYPIYNAFMNLNLNAILDGEIVVVNKSGLADFAALQAWRSEADGYLAFYAFDILWLDGYDLMDVKLKDRRSVLQTIIPAEGVIRVSEIFDVSGQEFFALAEKMKLEGIIAKKEDSLYLEDKRSKEWLKIKTKQSDEAVIGGYTINENSSRKLSALLLGRFEGKDFVSTGTVGTGFTAKMQTEIVEKLKHLEVPQSPFREPPVYNKPTRFRPNPPKAAVVWVKPELVAEISYRTVASDGTYRHPSFKGLREDRHARDVVLGEALPTLEGLDKDNPLLTNNIIAKQGELERNSLLNPSNETQVRIINAHELKFTNLSKVFWPESGVTKRDMLNYYYQVTPYMLAYMKDRPQTLNRFPNGIKGKSFYQKDVTGKVPDWIKTHSYYSENDAREKNFLVCADEASLLYAANLGCIEMNPWSSRAESPDNPDWCIIDLDPDKNTFDQVIEAAQVTHEVLDALEVPSYCKTSGSTGLHIYISFGPTCTYEDSKEFGRKIAKVVHSQIPSFTSIERLTSKRNGKMYLDFLQNRPQATVAAPYSLRPKPGAPVSMPLHWDEVKKGLKMLDFTIHNAVDRLKEQGDMFKGVLSKGANIGRAEEKLNSIFKLK